MKSEQPKLTVDAVVFDDSGRVLLIRRKNPPFQGQFALPGGFVDVGETTEAAALRELKEETGIGGSSPRLVGVYSDPKRDPRFHTVSVAYLVVPASHDVCAGDDASHAEFVANWRAESLAFDHHQIISDALRAARAGAER